MLIVLSSSFIQGKGEIVEFPSMEERNIEFVREIEKRPELYDVTNPGYSRKNIVDKLWAEVGWKFNLTASESKERWRNLRSTFVRYLRQIPGGSSTKKKRPYYLSEAMRFTLPFVKGGKNIESLPDVSSHSKNLEEPTTLEISFIEDYETPDQPEPQPASPSLPPPTSPSLPPPPHPSTSSHASPEEPAQQAKSVKRERIRTSKETDGWIADYFLAKKKYVEAKQNAVSGQSEALKMFLLSLLPDLESLTPDKIRIFKRATLDLVDDLINDHMG